MSLQSSSFSVAHRILPFLGLLIAYVGGVSAVLADGDVTLPARTVSSGEVIPEHADHTLTASSYTIQANGHVTFSAGQQINLNWGFNANPGADFNAFIDANKNGIPDWMENFSGNAVPYWTSFESSQGFVFGNLGGQNLWLSGPDSTPIINTLALEGAWSVKIPARNSPNWIKRNFSPPASGAVMFVDFFVKPSTSATVDTNTQLFLNNARIGFIPSGNFGQAQIFYGNGVGGGNWNSVGRPFSVESSGQASSWLRITVRLDFGTKKWDLFLNGDLVAYDIGMVNNSATYLSYVQIYGGISADTVIDDFYVNAANPLFYDEDQDGMDDVWELENGLNTNANDRNGDADGDGVLNIEEYKQGTPANVGGERPAAPFDLTVSSSTSSSISLSWNAPASTPPVSYYNVYRNGVRINDVPVTGTSFTDTSVQANTTYEYTVKSITTINSSQVISGFSNPVLGTAANSSGYLEVFLPMASL